ncbi:hypothetical protein IZY60_04875 [Lutibacter sp. B2]|nr:hypothetical protein [Lutibacter sp. B2]
MKKIIVPILAVSVLLGGCSKTLIDDPQASTQKKIDQKVVSSGEIINKDSKKIMAEYVRMMKKEAKPYEVVFFIDKNIRKVVQENANEMIIELESYQNIYGEKYTDILFSKDFQIELMRSFSEKADEEAINQIQDAKLKDLMYEMIHGGYKFISLEGDYYPIINYEVLKKYKSYLSDDIKEYIDLMAEESNQVMSDDAGLMISLDELGNRVITVEKHLEKYPDSRTKKQASTLYLNYFQAYIWGLPNTPLWDTETKKISDEALSSYKKIVAENKESKSAKALKDYIKAIEANNMKETDQINQFRDGLYKEVVQQLNIE